MAAPVIRALNLTKRYGRHEVFHDVSFELASGESILVRGPSGCGKTTLLRCLALLEPIQGGRIELQQQTILRAGEQPRLSRSVRLKISMVFQQLHLWPHLSILENVAIPLTLRGNGTREAAVEEARRVLATLGIADKEAEYPVTLSGGQQQRVALARALVHSPLVLLLDEITANLDSDTAAQVLGAVAAIRERGTAVVLVSHNPTVPAALRDHTLTYSPGERRWLLEQRSA